MVLIIAQPRYLHRRRLAGKDQKPVARRMTRKIDQDIDAISQDTLGQLLVRQSNRHQPVIGKPLQMRRNKIGTHHVSIANTSTFCRSCPRSSGSTKKATGCWWKSGDK